MRAALLAALLIFVPTVASAEFFGPLVPACAYTPKAICVACDIIKMIDTLLKFFVAITAMGAALMLAYAGILYVTAAGSPSNIESAKKIFGGVFLGLILVITSFLIVDLVMRTFTGQPLTVWSTIQCVPINPVSGGFGYSPPDGSVTPGGGGGTGTTTPGGGGTGTTTGQYRLPTQVCNSPETCQRLDPNIQCKEGVCYCTPELCSKLGLLQQNYDGTWQVTEDSVQSFSGHGRTCHGNGTCGDLNFTGRLKTLSDKMAAGTATPAEIDELAEGIKKMQRAGEQSGLNLQYEVATPAQRAELIRRGVPPDQVIAYSGQSAFHFSYLQCKPANPRNSCPVQSGG